MSQERESRMRRAFKEKSKHIINNVLRRKIEKPIVGVELELGLFDEAGNPIRRNLNGNCKAGMELGNHQIEIITDPLKIISIEKFAEDYSSDISETLSGLGQKVAGVGSIPNLRIEDFEVTPGVKKYEVVPRFHNERVQRVFKTMFPQLDARHMGLFNALQINMDCESVDDAVDKLNKSIMVSPYLVALFANSRYVDHKDTGFRDCRIKVWEETHDTRNLDERRAGKETRIGLPTKYFASIKDYLSRVSNHPFILSNEDHAFNIGIGLFWKDARIKFLERNNNYIPLVEMRSISAQQSTEEDLAVILMYIGLIHSQSALQDISLVKYNRESALKHGLEGMMVDENGLLIPTMCLLEKKFSQVKSALLSVGYDKREIEKSLLPVERILSEQKTPADRYAVNEISTLVQESFRN